MAVPLLGREHAIGVLLNMRYEVRPFTDQQIALLETFADQAVIAIENARLFSELEQRNAELRRSLERAAVATSEILRAIADAPTDLDAVFDALARNAARVCGADDAMIDLVDGEDHYWVAHHGPFDIRRKQHRAHADQPDARSSAARSSIDRPSTSWMPRPCRRTSSRAHWSVISRRACALPWRRRSCARAKRSARL